jgi:sulfur relay (sulfurtransferase) DsrF/TusC family protein
MARIIILIRTDPKESPRATEAIRIALGLVSCQHTIDLVLAEQVPLLLTTAGSDCLGYEMAQQYLSALSDFVPTIYALKDGLQELSFSQSAIQVEGIGWSQISQKMAAAESVMVF